VYVRGNNRFDIDLVPLVAAIEKLLTLRSRVVIGIDGDAAAGKTWLATKLKTRLGATLFHADDYFLPLHMRTAERLQESGGNLDRERLQIEVLGPARTAKSVVHRKFDCRTGQLSAGATSELARVVIVEGSYSLHPMLADAYDLKIAIFIDASTQLARITCRGSNVDDFAQKWIPLEKQYASATHLRARVDFAIQAGS
jgi:uridine kinase